MLRSMTGYGKAELQMESKKFSAEVRSLNSKGLDLNVRVPNLYREHELTIRTSFGERIQRGKAEISLYIENIGGERRMQFNTELLDQYYNELVNWTSDKNLGHSDILATIMRMPDVTKVEQPEPNEHEWTALLDLIHKAYLAFEAYRHLEGAKLKTEFDMRIANIMSLRSSLIAPMEERKEKTREKLRAQIDEWVGKEKLDENRFEQELIYYLEKLDVSEELQRLQSNCEMFTEELNGAAQGRKLGFISQEIGREINTIGSKANDATMQRMVVEMKDELEKIKEQINNVL
ncbi:MAG: YicC family protein [Bacteroidetes bacterium]|nr:YicC family protein [Bacteroidota bacterium]